MIGHNHLGKNGRFGNQMFQYAATRGIAANRGFDFCIPPGPINEEEFNDEENQHKLFMAFKLLSVKEVNMFPAPYRQEESFTFDELYQQILLVDNTITDVVLTEILDLMIKNNWIILTNLSYQIK